MGVTVTFIAILELMKEGLIEIVQAEPYARDPRAARRRCAPPGGRGRRRRSRSNADAENEAALAQPAHRRRRDEEDDLLRRDDVAGSDVPSSNVSRTSTTA